MRNVVEYVITAIDKTSGAINSATGKLRDFTRSVFSNLANIKAGFDMARDTISKAAGAIADTIREAFKFESATIQFAVLMKSIDKARERMQDLIKFANETPFELEGTMKASRLLHVFTNGVMGDIESLKMVGNTAAAIGTPIEDLAFWIGRAYSMVKTGKGLDEAGLRLQEIGFLTPEVRKKISDLQEAGASAGEVWSLFAARMTEFDGGMERMSKTGEGLFSTLKDTVTEAKRTFGQEFVDAAKVAIDSLTKKIQSFVDDGSIKQWAQKSLEYIYIVAGAVKSIWEGGEDRKIAFGAMKDVLVGSFEMAARSAINILIEHGPKVGLAIGKVILEQIKGISGNRYHEQYKQAAMETGVFDASSNLDNAKSMLHQDWWTIPDDKKEAFNNRVKELIKQRQLDEGKEEPIVLTTQKLENGLKALKNLSAKFKGNVDVEASKIKAYFEDESKSNKPNQPANIPNKVKEDLENADKDRFAKLEAERIEKEKKRIAEEEKKRFELEQKLNEERIRLQRKEIEDRISGTNDLIKQEESMRSSANSRLAAAQAQVQKAWGWYRDKESLKRQMDEEKQQKDAEKRFEKEWDRLVTRRSDWRTAKNLSVDDEAVRRLGIAKEEESAAKRALSQIEVNTRRLSEKLDELLSMKNGV